MRRILGWLVLGVCSMAWTGDPGRFDFETFGRIIIQDNGRYKPLDTFARDVIRELTGKEYFNGMGAEGKPVFEDPTPIAAFTDLLFRPERYYHQPLVHIFHPGLKQDLGLAHDRVHFSYKELEALEEKLQELREPIKGKNRLLAKEDAINKAYIEWSLVRALLTRSDLFLRIVPLYAYDESLTWFSLKEAEQWLATDRRDDPEITTKMVKDIVTDYRELERSYQKGDVAGFNRLVRELDHSQKMLGGHVKQHQPHDPHLTANQKEVLVFPEVGDVEYEYAYNQLKPFKKAWLLYFITFVLFVLTWGVKRHVIRFIPLVPLFIGLGFHVYGFLMRWGFTGRQPWSDMYEAMTLMAFGVLMISMILSAVMKTRLFVMCASVVGMLILVLADIAPGVSSSVRPLMPALQTFWLTIHTPCIITGFGSGMMLMAVAHVYLISYLFFPGNSEFLERVNDFTYRILQVSVIFLTAGTCLGGVWAGDAWGRYWGWDMKEVWALATLLTYVAILHARVAGYIRGLGVSLCALGAFAVIFLTFYGVNVLFGQGLHSYGWGAGSYFPMIVFFAFEAVLAAVTLAIYFSRKSQPPGEAALQQ